MRLQRGLCPRCVHCWPPAKLTPPLPSFTPRAPKNLLDNYDALTQRRALGGALNAISHRGECDSHGGGSSEFSVMQRQWAASSKTVFVMRSYRPRDTESPGADFQTAPASSGVSVTSTATLSLFHSHEPPCQSSQNQADGAALKQKACKSWII